MMSSHDRGVKNFFLQTCKDIFLGDHIVVTDIFFTMGNDFRKFTDSELNSGLLHNSEAVIPAEQTVS
jgi:hypothetical protein